jgi:hypothetical protein
MLDSLTLVPPRPPPPGAAHDLEGSDALITMNTVANTRFDAIFVDGRDASVSGNKVRAAGDTFLAAAYGAGSGISATGAGATIAGNVVRDVARYGILSGSSGFRVGRLRLG